MPWQVPLAAVKQWEALLATPASSVNWADIIGKPAALAYEDEANIFTALNKFVRTGISTELIEGWYTGESFARWSITVGGKMAWGTGASGALDTNLYRNAANQLKTDGAFEAAGGLTVGGVNVSLSGHLHSIAHVAGLQTALDGKASLAHTHLISEVTGLQTALDGKASSSHSHAISDVTGLQTALDGKATLAASSNVFTGNLQVGGQGWSSIHDQGNISGSVQFNFNNGNVIHATLTGNVTAVDLTSGNGGAFYTLVLKQDATGGRTVAGWLGTAVWDGGTAPTIASGANEVTVLTFLYDSVNSKWRGALAWSD